MRAGAVGIALLAFLVYLPSLGNGFVWDDLDHIVGNQQLSAPGGAIGYLTQPVGSYFRPVVFLSYVAERRVWGTSAVGAHLMNALVHALNAALLVVAARRSGIGPRTALAGAALFALHPVQTEAVAYVSGRTDLLMTCGALLSLIALLGTGAVARRALLTAAAGALAIGSKESGYALLGLWPYAALRTTRSWRLAMRLVGPAMLVGAILLAARPAPLAGTVQPPSGLTQIAGVGWALIDYVGVLLWPWPLLVDRLTPLPATAAAIAVGATVLIAAGAVSCAGVMRRGPIGVWSAWALLFYLPVANLIAIYPGIAGRALFTPEHNLYAPLAGAALVGAESMRLLLRRSAPSWRRAAVALLSSALVAWGLCTVRRQTDWRDEATLFATAAAAGSRSPRVWFNHGNALLAAGDSASATAFETASRLAPGDAEIWMNLAISRQRLGDFAAAADAYERAVELAPSDPRIWENFATLEIARGDRDAARAALARVMDLDPSRARARQALDTLNR